MKALSPNAALRALFRGELRYILRDPLALVLMLVVPVLAYPALFFGMDAMQGANAEKAETRELTIAGPPELAAWLLPGDALRVVDAAGPEAETADATLILPDGPGKGAVLHYRGDKRDGRNARDRLREVLERQRSRDQADAWASQGLTVQPDTLVALTWEDQATEAARAGAALGRILPLMLVFLVLSGGLYTALDLIAGEKERGTLETILTTRVARREVLRAKFLVVLLSTAAISLLALATLSASAMTGHFRLPGSETAIRFGPETAALAALLILPLVVELSALMVAAASFATDYRSGQAMSLPLMLVVLAPAAVPAISGLESGLAVGLLPITGVAVALRDALTGELSLGLGAWAFCWAAVHAGGALFLAEKLVGRESVLLGGGSARARYAKGRYHVEALALYAVVLLIFWFFGQLMQQRDLALGLLASQLLLIALPIIARGAYDIVQTRHAILRNFPLIGHFRYLLEHVRPEIVQYFIEQNHDGRPLDR